MLKTEIKHKWITDHSVDDVWEYLTKSELIEKWLMPNDFEPIIGHEFTFTTNPIPSLGLNGSFYCKVLEIEPKTRLVYSWKGGESIDTISLDTLVEWTLKPYDGGSELSLVHSGFKGENLAILTAMYDGWNKNINKMIVNLEKTTSYGSAES